MCTWLFERLLPVLLPPVQVLLPPLPDSALVPDENSMEDPLCNSAIGSMVSLDYVTPDTGYEPKDMELADTNELNLVASSDIYFQDILEDTVFFPNPDIDDNELAEFLAVVVDRTGQSVEVRSNSDQFSCSVRNVRSAQSQFLLVTQPKKMISQTGRSVQERIAEERESSKAQIRTPLNEQRKTIIAEYSEKVLHHEFLAAQAEQDRRILQEELLRQQQDFREVHQQDLMKQKELQKFQNSTFDEFAQKKFIEDQKIIMELSGRLQELQNEVNFMIDSKDFRDAESICSGNSHVTSQPGIFPKHPPLQGMAREMGSPRHVPNRRRRTREGPEPACVLSPFGGGVVSHGTVCYHCRIKTRSSSTRRPPQCHHVLCMSRALFGGLPHCTWHLAKGLVVLTDNKAYNAIGNYLLV